LHKEYKILKLRESESTVLGIANIISRKLTSDINLLITGIKAYNQDEIRLICEMLSPKIIIITGINNGKLYANQLINSLSKNGIVLFNGRDKNAYWLYQTTKKNKAIYNYLTIPADITINNTNNHSITAYNIKQKSNTIAFDVIMNGKSLHLIVNESKQHKIEYILPAIYTARYLGIKTPTLKKRLLS
jgi:UDP-N-acetylmuramyl pentapeptide synthase